MTIPITGTGSSGTTTPDATTAASLPTLDKDDFLQMLVAQLKNQDPLSPMDGTQFAAQLAQFSTVEQLTDLNTTETANAATTTQATLAQQASFGTSLIGRDVVTSGSNVTVADGQPSRISVDLNGAAANVRIDIIGSDGKTIVGSQNFSSLPTGTSNLTLDTSKLADGAYTYNVTATDTGGKTVASQGFSVGTVQGTMFQNGQVELNVNGTPVPLTDIVEILPVANAAATTSNTTTNP